MDSLPTDSNNFSNEEAMFRQLGIDDGMIKKLEEASLIIKPSERVLVPTGIHFELPESMEIQVRPRSGLAIKNGVTVLNTPGTVDRGYNGEIKVILINLSKENFTVNHGDRVAQAVISPVVSGRWAKIIKVDSLSDSDRSDGGFGSTGIN